MPAESFRFRSGRVSLDLTATVVGRYREQVEQLSEPADLVRWFAAAGMEPAPMDVTPADLEIARELREAIYALAGAARKGASLPLAGGETVNALAGAVRRRTSFPPDHLRTVNAIAAHPPPEPRLGAEGSVAWHAGAPTRAGLSHIARDAIALLMGPLAARIGECAAEDCALLFVDTSRPGRRRWCAENRCGNRQHVREYRERRRPTAS